MNRIKNKVQLITYPDSLGGDLKGLKKSLNKYFPNAFQGGIHILPPFPSSGDRGFAPINYFEIEPSFGSWEDMKSLGAEYEVMVDLMVNHVSQQSEYFQDVLKYGKASEYWDMFITPEKVWGKSVPPKADLEKIFLRRDTPFSTYERTDGEPLTVWTTFGKEVPSEQIDLDIKSNRTKNYQKKVLQFFAEHNISSVRLDAVGYVIKKPGTSCFFVRPDIYDYMEEIANDINDFGMNMLPEVHAEKEIQFEIARKGYPIYDFILPYLILSTIINRSAKELIDYLKSRPDNQITMLDCHDGLPVLPDLDGYIDMKNAQKVADTCVERGANLSKIYGNTEKFNVHQINGTIYSLLGENDEDYLFARAIQLFVPGIPQIYYVGLLAGKNDKIMSEEDGRNINRHNFSDLEIQEQVKQPVVQKLLKLIHLRNSHPAFNGQFNVTRINSKLLLSWTLETEFISFEGDVNTSAMKIEYSQNNGRAELVF